MTSLPDVRALAALPFDRTASITGLHNAQASRAFLDMDGMWWTVPFVRGESGCTYAFRLSPGEGHGAVLRCLNGHAVTIGSSPGQAVLAVLALERLLLGDSFRAKLVDHWSEVRDLLRDAITLAGGDPEALERTLHVADHLPNWVSPAPADQEERRRSMLLQIIGENPEANAAAWQRWKDSRLAPGDAPASLRLLQGNHGLDGTHRSAGLTPEVGATRDLLVRAAKRVVDAKLEPAPGWNMVIRAISERAEPTPDDFIAAVGSEPSAEAWEAWAATSFWFKAVGGTVPTEHVEVVEEIAETLGTTDILDARQLWR